MPNTLYTLQSILERLNIPYKARYTIEEVAEILGIRRDQVLNLLHKGRLIGVRATERRWAGVFPDELEAYLERIHNPIPTPTPIDPVEGL
jgi:excisionase family DNA binding protein